jgi:hypothetical protein
MIKGERERERKKMKLKMLPKAIRVYFGITKRGKEKFEKQFPQLL